MTSRTHVEKKRRPIPIAASWKRIDAWLLANTPAVAGALAEGATKKELEAAAKKLGGQVPTALAESLAVHNGEGFGGRGLIGNWSLMSLKHITSERNLMNKLVADGAFGDAKSAPHPRIKTDWWNPAWIPFVGSGSGHFLCIDSDPAPSGKAGQVILFLHDDERRFVVAGSLADYLAEIASDLNKGEYTLDGDRWNDEAFLHSSLEGRDLYKKRR